MLVPRLGSSVEHQLIHCDGEILVRFWLLIPGGCVSRVAFLRALPADRKRDVRASARMPRRGCGAIRPVFGRESRNQIETNIIETRVA